MLLVKIDRSSRSPAFLQIRDRIIELIEDGTLRPGEPLPPTRVLATSTGVHRSTVVRAYEEIRALGYIDSRPGSFTRVRRRARPPATASRASSTDGPRRSSPGSIGWQRVSARGADLAHAYLVRLQEKEGSAGKAGAAGTEGLIDFDRLAADPALAPGEDIRRCFRTVLLRSGGAALDYADPGGWQPLRDLIASRMRSHGVAVSAEEVLITGGAQHALDLIFRLLVSPGDRVIVEAPTYGMAHSLFRLHEAIPVEIDMRSDGIDLDALESELSRRKAALVYTMPNFQNPTGITTDQAHRERLLSIVEKKRIPLVEDGFEEEMKYTGHAVLPIKSIDSRGTVLYIGTFSKVVFPGLRIGWIAAPARAVERLTSIQRSSCLAGNTLAQAAVTDYCSSGLFEPHLRRMHRIYRRRMHVMLHGLQRHMPEDFSWTRPAGGYSLWLSPPTDGPGEAELHRLASRAGVLISPGSRYYSRPRRRPNFRLSIACVDEERIEEGCRRLGRAFSGRLR